MEHKAHTGSFKCRKCGATVQSENIYLCPTCTEKILGSGLSEGMRRSLEISGFFADSIQPKFVATVQPKDVLDLGNITLPDAYKGKEVTDNEEK